MTFLPHHFSFKMLSTFKPSAKSFCSDLDQVLFLPRLGQLLDDSSFWSVFAYPFFKLCITSDFISGVNVHLPRHTPVRTTEISLNIFIIKSGWLINFWRCFLLVSLSYCFLHLFLCGEKWIRIWSHRPWLSLLTTDVCKSPILSWCKEHIHMTSRRPYWYSKTMKRRPCWCTKTTLWELNSFLMKILSFVRS